MESHKSNSLPIIMVSAKDQDSANTLISAVIDNEQSDRNDCVWRLKNKYYSADVQFNILLDGEDLKPQLENLIEGHIIYLTEDEASSDSAIKVMEQRMHSVKSADVRVVVADSDFEDSALVSVAATHHYELIPIRALADPDVGEVAGPDRIRAALHAHMWPGMHAYNCLNSTLADGEEDSDSDSWSSWQGANETRSDDDENDERWVDRVEAFAAALGSLPQAAAAVRSERGNRALRVARAELVLAAFCDALGEPLHLPQERLEREL